MKTFSRAIVVMACLLSLIGLSGCEQAEEAKKAAGELMTETVDKAQQVIGEVTGTAEEFEGEGEEEKEEEAKPAEEKDKEKGE